MTKVPPEQLVYEWAAMLGLYSPDVREQVGVLAQTHQHALATHFYDSLLRDPAASRLVSHDQVKARLHASMMQWIAGVFASGQDVSPQRLVDQQVHIGEVHARIDVPVHLVLRGARSLKLKFHALLQDVSFPDPRMAISAAHLVSSVVDLAMEIMSQAYARSHERSARADEAYRLLSMVQNTSTERQRQRAALLDWESELMYEIAVGAGSARLPRICAGEFGLWFRHKGAHAFQGASEADSILNTMDQIDTVLLPAFEQSAGHSDTTRQQGLRELRERTKGIAFDLDALFQQSSELEAGRDVLTNLLNRKFLPVVLSKEVAYARQRATTFAVVAIDIDHFKQVNDTYGHEAGDMVLQQMAVLLSDSSRGGDYLFRLGGEEFMMLLVDVDQQRALKVAEKLRAQVEAEVFHLPLERTMPLTISIGLALHDGHPDYQRTLRRADDALYRAKNLGRNRIVVAEDTSVETAAR